MQYEICYSRRRNQNQKPLRFTAKALVVDGQEVNATRQAVAEHIKLMLGMSVE